MKKVETAPNPYWNERLASVVSHGFLVGMMMSIAVSAAQFGARLTPGWDGSYLTGLTVVVSLGAILGNRFLRGRGAFQGDWFVYRAAELVVLGVLLRLWLYYYRGIGQLATDISTYGIRFVNYFNDPEFLVVLVFCILIWIIASGFSGDLVDLEGDITIIDRDTFRFALQDRKFARARIVNRVFSVGILLVVMSALVRADIGMIWQDRPTIQGGGINILVYFVLGLLLFSVSHFSSLRALWIWDRFSIGQNLARNWLLYGLLFLVALGGVASLLPTRYSLGFLDLITYLISIIFYGIYYLFSVFLSLISLIIYLLGQLFNLGEAEEGVHTRPPPEFRPPAPDPLPTEAAVSPWQTITSLIFWFIFLAAVYYAFYYYFRQHRARFSWIRELMWLQNISKGWRWFRDLFSGWNRSMLQAFQEGIERFRRIDLPDSAERLKPNRIINPLRLSPRRRVMFFYFGLIRRGGRSGLPRSPGQTPYEYAESLEKELPEVDAELEQLTEAFVKARYSRAEIEKEDAHLARKLWGKIQRAFRRR